MGRYGVPSGKAGRNEEIYGSGEWSEIIIGEPVGSFEEVGG